jgi:hypothetical protein
MRSRLALAAALVLTLVGSGTAGAASISVTLASDNSGCANGTYNNTNESSVCAQNGSLTYDDWGASWSTSDGTSPNLVGDGSTSATFKVDAAVAADDGGADVGQGGDRWIQAALDFDLTITIDVDGANDSWTVDLSQAALGLYGLNGDGVLSAVGNQDDGSAEMTDIVVVVDGSNYDVDVAPNSYSADCSNTCLKSQQFSGSRSDNGVLAGTGDAVFNVSISLSLEAFSNDGCSGFICSSASGGEEAGVLFGIDGIVDEDVDDYAKYGRAVGPDGYDATFVLNVTVPEPTSLGLLGGGALVLACAGWSRRRRG